jgi:3-hydroxyisobutyrate dehydrogenase-like beta-hydroxyacid dehydrogenase
MAKAGAALDGDVAPGFALRLAFKDVGLVLDAARERDLELPITDAISRRWQQAIADGHGDEDVAAVIAVASPRAAV